jgi:hypothetical protein
LAWPGGPLLAWKAFLLFWLGSLGFEGAPIGLSPIPFGGILYRGGRHQLGIEQLRTVILPALLCGGAAFLALVRRIRQVEIWALLVNAAFYTVFLGDSSFNDISSSARVTVPIALAAVLCVPYFPARTLAWFWASAALWLAPIVSWLMIPTARAILAAIGHRL